MKMRHGSYYPKSAQRDPEAERREAMTRLKNRILDHQNRWKERQQKLDRIGEKIEDINEQMEKQGKLNDLNWIERRLHLIRTLEATERSMIQIEERIQAKREILRKHG